MDVDEVIYSTNTTSNTMNNTDWLRLTFTEYWTQTNFVTKVIQFEPLENAIKLLVNSILSHILWESYVEKFKYSPNSSKSLKTSLFIQQKNSRSKPTQPWTTCSGSNTKNAWPILIDNHHRNQNKRPNEASKLVMVWLNHVFSWLKPRNNTKQQEEIQ